ncbi:MAG: exodeoxyribonuclease VII small subunit [Methylotenera sp.]
MSNKHPTSQPSFESAITELETLVSQMESANLPLEQSISAYKRGAELLQVCQKSLSDAEQQVRILTEANKLTVFNPSNE